METKVWYQLSRKETLLSVASRSGGLTKEEAVIRQEKFGFNQLAKEKPLSAWRVFITQVQSPLVYVLAIAALLSLFVGETFDVIVILVVVAINTFVGFWQEYKADKAIAKLKSLITYRVTVLRDGSETKIDSKGLVPGDVMILEAGDRVSADARLIEVNNLQVNEASLTGESFPVEKHTDVIDGERTVGDRSNMLFQGTTIVRGRARAVVVAIGSETEIGHIASLVQQTEEEKTPLQLQLGQVSKLLTFAVVLAAFSVFLLGALRQEPLRELFITAVALAVAAIPEGLLVSMTLVLVIGMQRILKRKAIVRRLVAAETLGSVSVVCSDKTGTITQGKMIVDQVLVGGELHNVDHSGNPLEEKIETQHVLAVKAAALCNNAYIKNPQDKLKAWHIEGDSTETALLLAAGQLGLDKDRLNSQNPRLDEIPFQEEYKFMATLHKTHEGETMVFLKGAPEIVAAMSSHYLKDGKRKKIDEKLRQIMKEEYESLTKAGLRVLAVAQRKVKASVEDFNELVEDRSSPSFQEMDFIGWIGLKDPVRDDVPAAFKVMKQAGIRTVIITGDHKYTVQAIVKEIGMDVSESQIMEGTELEDLSDEELMSRVKEISIFARVEPKHKLRIVQAWRKHNEVIAVLGDGVNDAPALKAADIGIAVEEGTDVAKETADMILVNSNFAVIESAIREGRVIFDNIRKIFLYLIADSFTEVLLISLVLFAGYPLPLAAIHILWINLISDGPPALSLASEPAENDVMMHPPRKKGTPLVNQELKVLIFTITVVATLSALAIYHYAQSNDLPLTELRTMTFALLSLDSLFFIFCVKNLRLPLWRIRLLSNPIQLFSVAIAFFVQLTVIQIPFFGQYLKTTPLSVAQWGVVVLCIIFEIIAFELVKYYYSSRMDRLELKGV